MKKIQIPDTTKAELQSPAAPGSRHRQALRIALNLLNGGLVADAVLVQLRSMYDSDVTDEEIAAVVSWAVEKTSNGAGRTFPNNTSVEQRYALATHKHSKPDDAIQRARDWLNGYTVSEERLKAASPCCPLENFRLDSMMLLSGLYGVADNINVLTEYVTDPSDPGKARPCGAGITLRRDDWLRRIRESGTPQSDAGAWVRPNPVHESGTGRDGAFRDDDVAAHRFLLVESDILPEDLQLAVIATLKLPVAAVISSGGRSYHAWVQINASDAATYKSVADKVLAALEPLGFDPANKNPSRLSRLPGAQRVIGSGPDRRQRLVYLNPDATHYESIFKRP